MAKTDDKRSMVLTVLLMLVVMLAAVGGYVGLYLVRSEYNLVWMQPPTGGLAVENAVRVFPTRIEQQIFYPAAKVEGVIRRREVVLGFRSQ